MPKITKAEKPERRTITAKTKEHPQDKAQCYKWWKAQSKKQLCDEVLATASFLKTQQSYRYKQASVFARLYGNMPIGNALGVNTKMAQSNQQLPIDRPTMNVVQSCVDTLVSRITQSRPRPIYLTDNGNYKQRTLSKQLNNFMDGELYQTKAHQLGEFFLRDATVLGTGCLKVFEKDARVALERVLATELLIDPNEALYGQPRQMFQLKLVDRGVLQDMFPDYKNDIAKAEQAYVDESSESSQTVSDQVMVVEAWHLPSGEDAKDGRHVIACMGATAPILDEDWEKPKFPFVFMHYSPRMLGFWAQGLAEQIMGTQIEINKLLITISQSINIVGVPRVFVEKGSKVSKAFINNMIGAIVEFQGTKPSYEVAPCVPQELYGQLQRLVDYAYQQSGISALAAASKKPAGLDSGKAIREFDDLQSDRFAALDRRYHNAFIELAYQITDLAKDIAIRDEKYQTIYPNKDGTREVDLPKAALVNDAFVIQCYDSSMLPRDPAARKQAIIEDMQAGIISPEDGRRLLNYPDLEQSEKLASAAEERILKILDGIVESGKYVPPDPFMNLDLGIKLVTQYYNLYAAANLEEKKAQQLRDFFTQLQAMKQAMTPPPPAGPAPGAGPQAVPQAPPVSDMIPNAPGVAA